MSKKNPLLPDFLIIGAGKSGTTSLDSYLNQHPNIFISPVKEPDFFAYLKHKEEDFDIPESRHHFLEAVRTFEDYYQLFEGAAEGQLKGETSNTYLYGKYSVETIAEHIPDVKLIVIFRQPAERLYSRFLHLARENLLPTENFEDCLDRDTIWWQRPDLINEGFYHKHLSRFYDVFPKENIKVFLFEDLRRPDYLFKELFSFLGVETGFVPETERVFNQSGYVKNQWMNKMVGPNGLVIRSVKRVMPGLVRWAKRNTGLEGQLESVRTSNLHKPKLDPEMKKKLTAVYESDIKALEQLTGKDLSHWYNL